MSYRGLVMRKTLVAFLRGLMSAKYMFPPKFGDCISIKNVAGRTHALIHSGNYTRHTHGCILVGDSLTDMNNDGEIDVSNSKLTLGRLIGELPQSFQLVIQRITK